MRVFIVLCLVATAFAQYNYSPSDSGRVGGGHVGGLGGVGGNSGLGGSSGAGNSISGGSNLGGSHHGPSVASGPAEYQKEFYSFSAPDHEFDDADGHQNIANSLKKNLRVIFIKGPENKGLENAALQLAKSASDDKTAIYVLQKQSDIGNLAQQLQALKSQTQNKPEVHFVKYRTPEDAQNAQHAIQSQYDQLPGQSQSHDGGNANVLNFASKSQAPARTAQAPGNAYLPSSVFKLFR